MQQTTPSESAGSTPIKPERMDFDNCVAELRALGLSSGDMVLVRAALGALGPLADPARSRADLVIGALLEVVGSNGLILGLSFSRNDWSIRFPKLPPYQRFEPAITGGFVASMLAWEGAYRSMHPTNSFVAIGRGAEALLTDHDQTAPCFGPMASLVEQGGKMLLIGCEDSSPGFSTVHLAQHRLGLDTKTWMSLVFGRRYSAPSGALAWYRKHDVPGCSMGFSNFYPIYRDKGLLYEGKIGAANSLLIDARSALEAELEQLKVDPTVALCDNNACLTCRLGWFYKPMELRRYIEARLKR